MPYPVGHIRIPQVVLQPLKAAVQDNEHLLERYGLVNALYKFLFVKILVGHHSEKQALFLLISLYCQMISRISGAFYRLWSVYADKIRQLVFIYQAAAQHCGGVIKQDISPCKPLVYGI